FSVADRVIGHSRACRGAVLVFVRSSSLAARRESVRTRSASLLQFPTGDSGSAFRGPVQILAIGKRIHAFVFNPRASHHRAGDALGKQVISPKKQGRVQRFRGLINGPAELFGHRRRHLSQTNKRNGSTQPRSGFPTYDSMPRHRADRGFAKGQQHRSVNVASSSIPELSATLQLSDYGRVVRDSGAIPCGSGKAAVTASLRRVPNYSSRWQRTISLAAFYAVVNERNEA